MKAKLAAGVDLNRLVDNNAKLLRAEVFEIRPELYYSVRFYNKLVKQWIELARMNRSAAHIFIRNLNEESPKSIYCIVEVTDKYEDCIKLVGEGT
jgi:hypothetical protein